MNEVKIGDQVWMAENLSEYRAEEHNLKRAIWLLFIEIFLPTNQKHDN